MPTVMLSLKLLFISTTVLSAAVALRLSAPVVADFAVHELPSLYNLVLSWLQPPYLYLVINCIIITIVASSKLQSKTDDVSPPPVPSVKSTIETDHFTTVAPIYHYNDAVLNDSISYELKEEKVVVPQEFDAVYEQVHSSSRDEIETKTVAFAEFPDDVTSNKENEYVVSKLKKAKSMEKKDAAEYSPKPPVSARFGHRRTARANPEGGRTVLGVSKPKKQETLESTWKTITEGRAVPLNRHLRKSDTWEREGRTSHRVPPQEDKTPKKMTKSETFNDRTNTRSPSPGSTSSGGSGKIRKEPSLSQDELNRRVEAFIRKFNEDMRMQRQESLNQYKQMVNRGSR